MTETRREEVARIIDPYTWGKMLEQAKDPGGLDIHSAQWKAVLTKADAITALLSAPDNGGKDLGAIPGSGSAGCSALEGWRPIETAPKDGTPILAFCPDLSEPSIVMLDWVEFDDGEPGHWADRWSERGEEIEGAPTRWQPLPQPPIQQTDAIGPGLTQNPPAQERDTLG